MVGLVSELKGNDILNELTSAFFIEVERMAINLLSSFENNAKIPVLEKIIIPPPDSEGGNIYKFYSALDYLSYPLQTYSAIEVYDSEFYEPYTFDYNKNADEPFSTITKKDIIETVRHILKKSQEHIVRNSSIEWSDEHWQSLNLCINAVELKWFLGIDIPESINSLPNGKMEFSWLRKYVSIEPYFVELLSIVYSKITGKSENLFKDILMKLSYADEKNPVPELSNLHFFKKLTKDHEFQNGAFKQLMNNYEYYFR